MAQDNFDPIEQAMEAAGNIKPTGAVKAGSKLLGPVGDVVGAGADMVQTGMDAMDTDGMAEALAARLGMNVEELKMQSGLAATAIAYHHGGEAALNAAVDIGTDVAAGLTGPVGMGAKLVFDYTLAEEKPDPTGDMRRVYEFVAYEGSVTPEMVFDAIKAKVSPADRNKLNMYGRDGLGSDSAIDNYVGELIGPDFVSGDESALEYLARKFNNGEYERASLILNQPVAMPPLDVLDLEAGLDEGMDPNLVASNNAGTLSYSGVDAADALPSPRTPDSHKPWAGKQGKPLAI